MNTNDACGSQFNCLLIDDDKTSLTLLENCLTHFSEMKSIKSYSDAASAIEEVDALSPIDFLFLDIKMPLSGIEVAKLLRDKVKHLIFITAYPDYALEAFSVHADHYLLKPITLGNLTQAVTSVMDREARIKKR